MNEEQEALVPQIVNTDTGEVIKAPEASKPDYSGASLLVLTENEKAMLDDDVDPDMVEIRPDGLVYLPQVFYRQQLNNTFGQGQWAIVQNGTHQDDNHLYFDGSLFIRGHFVARGVGEAQRYPDNPMQSWATVYESAKSDCLTRCCKDLGIAKELWQPGFGEHWQKNYAVKVWNGKKNKYEWRRRDRDPFWWEGKTEKGESLKDDPVGGQRTYHEEDSRANATGKPTSSGKPTDKMVGFLKKLLKDGRLPDSDLQDLLNSLKEDWSFKNVSTTINNLTALPARQFSNDNSLVGMLDELGKG